MQLTPTSPLIVWDRYKDQDADDGAFKDVPEKYFVSLSSVKILSIEACRWEHGYHSLPCHPSQVLCIVQLNGYDGREWKWDIKYKYAKRFSGSEGLEMKISELRSQAISYVRQHHRGFGKPQRWRVAPERITQYILNVLHTAKDFLAVSIRRTVGKVSQQRHAEA